MRIEFRFNGTQQIILTPENKKDEQLVQLFVGGFKDIRLNTSPAASPNSIIFESFNQEPLEKMEQAHFGILKLSRQDEDEGVKKLPKSF